MANEASVMSLSVHNGEPAAKGVLPGMKEAAERQLEMSVQLAKAGADNVAVMRAQQKIDEAKEPEANLPEPREDVESIVLALPDGREMEFGPRPGGSTAVRLAQILGKEEFNAYLASVASAMMYVRKVGGEEVPLPRSMAEVQLLCDRIGDQGVDMCLTAKNTYWPGFTRADLPLLKKNLRGP